MGDGGEGGGGSPLCMGCVGCEVVKSAAGDDWKIPSAGVCVDELLGAEIGKDLRLLGCRSGFWLLQIIREQLQSGF